MTGPLPMNFHSSEWKSTSLAGSQRSAPDEDPLVRVGFHGVHRGRANLSSEGRPT